MTPEAPVSEYLPETISNSVENVEGIDKYMCCVV